MHERKTKTTIFIKDLSADCVLGVEKQERSRRQKVVINVLLEADASKVLKTDDIADTLDYKTVYQDIMRLVENSKFHLLETLAQKIVDVCLRRERVFSASVRVEKKNKLPGAKSVGVEISQTK